MWNNGRYFDSNYLVYPQMIQRTPYGTPIMSWRPNSPLIPIANHTSAVAEAPLANDPFTQNQFDTSQPEVSELTPQWRNDNPQNWEDINQQRVNTSIPTAEQIHQQQMHQQQMQELEGFANGSRRFSQLWLFNPNYNSISPYGGLIAQPQNIMDKQLVPLNYPPHFNLSSNTTSNTTSTTTFRNANQQHQQQIPYETRAIVKVDSNGMPTQFFPSSPQDSPQNSPKKRRRDAIVPEIALQPRQLQFNEDSSPSHSEEEIQPKKKKKGRFVWSPELQESFEVAMGALGDVATAKSVMAMMAAKGTDISTLTRIRVANHMQYWLSRRNKLLVKGMKGHK